MDSRELESLVNEVRLLWNLLVQRGSDLHAAETVTVGMRAVLEALLREGPSTVPAIARRRNVTRQHVQMLVNALLERGLVTLSPNPSHRRSSLVTLTRQGGATIRRMKRREERLFERTASRVSPEQMRQAGAILAGVRLSLARKR
jgi:DNA-binding MarR family transcriptional regulator